MCVCGATEKGMSIRNIFFTAFLFIYAQSIVAGGGVPTDKILMLHR